MCTVCDREVQAARQVLTTPNATRECRQCRGSGVYYGRGGEFRGFKGPCFACHGHGVQTLRDVMRCATYQNHHRRIPA
jgi:DnaJ-class molecular chaperone